MCGWWWIDFDFVVVGWTRELIFHTGKMRMAHLSCKMPVHLTDRRIVESQNYGWDLVVYWRISHTIPIHYILLTLVVGSSAHVTWALYYITKGVLPITNVMSRIRNLIARKARTGTSDCPLLQLMTMRRTSNRRPPRPWLIPLIDQDSLPVRLFGFLRYIVYGLDRPEFGSSVLESWPALVAQPQKPTL